MVWSTTFIDRRVLPRSSKPSSLTLTLSPSLTTSEVSYVKLFKLTQDIQNARAYFDAWVCSVWKDLGKLEAVIVIV